MKSQEGFPRKEEASPEGVRMSRRSFLAGLGAVGATTVLGGREVRASETLEAVLAEYQQIGEVREVRRLYDYMKRHESARILPLEGSVHGAPINPEDLRTMQELAMQSIRDLYDAENLKAPGAERLRSAIEVFLRLTPTRAIDRAIEEAEHVAEKGPHTAYSSFLKLFTEYWLKLWPQQRTQAALSSPENIGTGMYNKDASTIHDPIVNARLSCRSGTYLFLEAASQILSPDDQKDLVIIYTNGHMLPGYRRRDGVFVGLEMTAQVERWPTFDESNSEKHEGYRIVTAHAAIAENILGQNVRRDTVLLEVGELEPTAPFTLLRTESSGVEVGLRESNLSTAGTEVHAFGKAIVPEGDTPRAQIDSVVYARTGGFLSPRDHDRREGREGN